MTVTTTYAPATFTGNGVTVEFALAHQVQQASHVVVTLDGVSSSAWSATGYGLPEGITVTMDVAPASAVAIIVSRVVPYTQDTDLSNFDGNPAVVTESQFDLFAMADQQIAESAERAIIVPVGATLTSNEISGTIDTTTRVVTMTTAGPAVATLASLSTTIDTTLTSLATNNILQWDGASWVNVTTAAIVGTTFADNVFRVQDNGDATKQLAFEVSGIATATTRTITAPNADVILDSTTVTVIGSIGGGTQDLELVNGIRAFSGTVDTSTTTFTFSNPKATGSEDIFTLRLTNGGSQTVNWPASVAWKGGTAPTLTTSGTDELAFKTIDGGTIWVGVALLDVS